LGKNNHDSVREANPFVGLIGQLKWQEGDCAMTAGIKKLGIVAAVAAGMCIAAVDSANAVLVGSRHFGNPNIFLTEPSAAEPLNFDLDGSALFSIPSAAGSVGTTFSLSSYAPAAFATLSAAFQNGVQNFLVSTGYGATDTEDDFVFGFPGATDLDPNFIIDEIEVTLLEFSYDFRPGTVVGDVYLTQYHAVMDVYASEIPVPAGIFTAAAGAGALVLVGWRRRKLG
jgi:hypothetical protein